MSQNPRGRPTKLAHQKKQVKKASDQKRYLKTKLQLERSSPHSSHAAQNLTPSHIAEKRVSCLSICIKYLNSKVLNNYAFQLELSDVSSAVHIHPGPSTTTRFSHIRTPPVSHHPVC